MPVSSEAVLQKWRRKGDGIALFADECLRPSKPNEDGTPRSQINSAYKAWCEEHGFKRANSQVLADRIHLLLGVPLPKRKTSGYHKGKWAYDVEIDAALS